MQSGESIGVEPVPPTLHKHVASLAFQQENKRRGSD